MSNCIFLNKKLGSGMKKKNSPSHYIPTLFPYWIHSTTRGKCMPGGTLCSLLNHCECSIMHKRAKMLCTYLSD
jgi:hypothetical protein